MSKMCVAMAGSPKLRNHKKAHTAKVEVRENVLAAIPGPVVFDAFAGAGKMYDSVWCRAEGYVGCDLDWWRDARLAYVADNRRVLRAVDLARFNIFDLDAFGSPWEQAIIVAARRPVELGEMIGLCLTDGSGMNMKTGGLPQAFGELTGIKGRPAGIARAQTELTNVAIRRLAERMGCEVVSRWEAKGKTGAVMRYIGLVLRGLGEA